MIRKAENTCAIVFTGGKGPEVLPLCQKDYISVIAADSGYELAIRNGFIPDLVVGDMDSTVNKKEIVSLGFEPASIDKDESDTELAIIKAGPFYDLVGGGEGRLDHLLSILSLFPKYGPPRFWFTREDVLIGVRNKVRISLPVDSLLSVIPVYGITKVASDGLKWELGDRSLSPVFMSLSNRTAAPIVEIECDKPILIRIEPYAFSLSAFEFA